MLEALRAPFPQSAVKWRIGSASKDHGKPWAQLLCYIDARNAYDRLDEVVGPENWQNMQIIETATQRVIQGVSIRIGSEWVTKWDGAGATATEGEKGGISDAFKRACVLWGIGRYLYGAGQTWAEVSKTKTSACPHRHYDRKNNVTFYWGLPKNAWESIGYSEERTEAYQSIGTPPDEANSVPQERTTQPATRSNDRPPTLPAEDKMIDSLVDFLSPLVRSERPDDCDLALDDLYRVHTKKSWGKGEEIKVVGAWIRARKAIMLAASREEVRAAYEKFLAESGYGEGTKPSGMKTVTHGQLANWLIDAGSERLIEVGRAA
jgi:hypothetical protein